MLRATGAFFCIGIVNFRLSLCLIVSVGNAVLGVPSEIPLDGQFSAYSYTSVQKMLRFALGTLRTAFPTRFCYPLAKLQFKEKTPGAVRTRSWFS